MDLCNVVVYSQNHVSYVNSYKLRNVTGDFATNEQTDVTTEAIIIIKKEKKRNAGCTCIVHRPPDDVQRNTPYLLT